MFAQKQVNPLMDLDSSLMSFINRVNDAYISSHSMHDLVNDSDYQKLIIKHGAAVGMPLGNRYLLPGYWFTVFVAPYESFQRVTESLKIESEQQTKAEEIYLENINAKADVKNAVENFKHVAGRNPLQPLIEKFQTDIEFLVSKIQKLDKQSQDTYPSKRPLKHVVTSIATGSYEFSDAEDDLTCTFFDNDLLCGYRFEAKVKVAEFNQFAIDFSKQLVELLWPIVENHKSIRKEVTNMLIGEVFLKQR